MKRNLAILLIIALSSLGFSEDSNVNESKVICAVSGEVIEGDYKEESAKYKEGEVYFCCGGCKMDFEEDPSKFSTTSNFDSWNHSFPHLPHLTNLPSKPICSALIANLLSPHIQSININALSF